MFLGVDPGKSGAMAVIDADSIPKGHIKLDETDADISTWLRSWRSLIRFGSLEKVGSMPGQGVSSTFKFGRSFGFVQGLMVAWAVPFELITPSKWQGEIGCRSGGDKNVTKTKAQQLFPEQSITHKTADAFLLAEYARRIWFSRKGKKA
jgi:crossover junction endodeoxyribonuclease RuvC